MLKSRQWGSGERPPPVEWVAVAYALMSCLRPML